MLVTIKYQEAYRVTETSEAVQRCFKCGVCSLVCPVTLYGEGYSPRESFVYDVFGSDEPAANPNLWDCPLCHKCSEVCPQDVHPPKAFESLREAAFKNGWAPSSVTELVESVIQTGSSYPLTDASRRARDRLNLPSLAPEGVDELTVIARNTGLQGVLHRLKAEKADEGEQ